MTEVLQSSPSHFPSSSSSSSTPCAPNNYNNSNSNSNSNINNRHQTLVENTCSIDDDDDIVQERDQSEQEPEPEEEDSCCGQIEERKERDRGVGDQLSILTLLVAACRKSLVGCSIGKELCAMEIGLPTDVRHVAHVTFDRFNGFLGLPVEFEPEVPRRAPSASANVFGVSTESMQLSFDSRGNSVPTILLLMQRHLYAEGGLQAEGIFRITAGNSQEEYVREQLNRGVVPDGIDVHCLAGLIKVETYLLLFMLYWMSHSMLIIEYCYMVIPNCQKAWFRELPTGVLDSLSPEQVIQSQSEEECAQLVRLLPPTEAALLDWAINLMADVAQMEHLNKMNARNVAMVFAPNMTQMSDPLTALMYAVQVMNLLKTLIIKTLKDREDTMIESVPVSRLEPSDENGHQSSSQPHPLENEDEADMGNGEEKVFVAEEPAVESPPHPTHDNSPTESGSQNFLTSIENIIYVGNRSLVDNCPCEVTCQVNSFTDGLQESGLSDSSGGTQTSIQKSGSSNFKNGSKKLNERTIWAGGPVEKSKGAGIVSRINPRTELFEAWR
ncbi:hypothetical protein EZV62_016069 [Acer yangbiense]|uniref:Rho-GAP domain-containing protein n=1 Tax=Acer yangbiense TaxID=1000413 RepID=A0A5C7HMI5_9ROSI|nr:hypothetical protein EZV62_016069 [Acer yangbiense]